MLDELYDSEEWKLIELTPEVLQAALNACNIFEEAGDTNMANAYCKTAPAYQPHSKEYDKRYG